MRRAFTKIPRKSIPNQAGVYQILNRINGKRYIGSSIALRGRYSVHVSALTKGKKHSRYLQNAWNKYGPSAFQFDILLICDKKDAIFYEQRAIDVYRSAEREFGYNLSPTAGSPLGVKHTPETCAQMSVRMLKRMEDPKEREKISVSGKGRIVTEKTRNKISIGNKGRIKSPQERLNSSLARKGKKQSKETVAKRAKALTGKKHTEETKKVLSILNTGKKHTEEAKQKIKVFRATQIPPMLGRQHTEFSKKKMSDASTECWKDPVQREKRLKYFDTDAYKQQFMNISEEEHGFRSAYVKKGWETRRRNNQ